ncbi:MAG TPA: serine/threonine-protein kinase [Burkholderiales bacterium]|jgi:serine/threonine protein kinase|nr:serine/threonine-protein kinase [Burkholderiales bacterium]
MDKIGKYRVIRKLGEGATSVVYLCEDPFNQRQVAIKRVNPGDLQDAERGHLYKKLFIAEASLAGKLVHPHIVTIYDAVTEEDEKYIVMEFVAGSTLEKYCAVAALLPIKTVVEVIFKCTRALEFAHKAGVTHRDIKPANIMMVEGDDHDVKITDFGAAISTNSNDTQVAGIGSPAYMSPQQVKEHPLDHRTDIYSLGVVMYQMLVGQLPFQASNNFSMIYQIVNTEPSPPAAMRPEIPRSVDHIVRRAMAKDLDDRYQEWEQFSLDLAEAFRNEGMEDEQSFADSEKFNTLRALPFFQHFNDVEIWEVCRFSKWEALPPGQVIMREGEDGEYFCILATGQVKVTRRNKLLNILDAGECVGEMAYLSTEKRRGADVSTMADAKIITVPTVALQGASDATRHQFDRAFLSILVERLNMANVRLSSV